MHELVFLKLGGSLITDKTKRYTPRLPRLESLAEEIQSALLEMPQLRLILGHGSGSFGHFAVQEYLAPKDSASREQRRPSRGDSFWHGFSEVWYRAAELNRYVMDALHRAGLAAIALPPSAMVAASDGAIVSWDLTSLQAAMDAGLVPVIYGDIVFDSVKGGTVLSTEALMIYLAHVLGPRRILLAGFESAVWADFPSRRAPIEKITPSTYPGLSAQIGASHGTDVTGGMKAKVDQMLRLVQDVSGLTVQIFSGEETGNLKRALAGTLRCTTIARD
jgi:isopentenyl phosphate kinase